MFYQFDENLDKEIHFDAEFDLERQRELAEEFEEMETNHNRNESYDQYCAMMESLSIDKMLKDPLQSGMS